MRNLVLLYASLGCLLLTAPLQSETIVTRDNAKANRPVIKIDFLLEPQTKSAMRVSRSLGASLVPNVDTAKLMISAWDDCRFEIQMPLLGKSGDIGLLSEMAVDNHPGIWWDAKSGERVQVYERKDGCLEWEIVLDSRPVSNRFNFPISSQNLLFLYQSDLSPEEIAEGAMRPDSVAGSYAVYHTFRHDDWKIVSENDTISEEYGTGKAFHIYRPQAHDATGKAVWCDLKIDSDLAITVPDDFLSAAVYPVTIDPTFGYSSAGASQTIPGTAKANINDAHTYLAGFGETITSFTVYASSGSGTQSLGLAAYTMDNGSPKLPVTRLATAATVSLTGGTAAWYTTATVSQALTSGTRYCVALGDGNSYTNIFYDSYGATARSNNNTSALPATWTNNGTGSVVYSMYATYTVSAGTVTPTRRRRTSFTLNPNTQKGDTRDDAMHIPANNGPVADGALSANGPAGCSYCEQ